MVRLYSPVEALELREPTQEGAQARFPGLPVGDYRVEVTSPGFDRAEETAEVMPGATVTVFVTLRAEGSGVSSAPGNPAAILSPRARKEMDKALAALQVNNLDEAQRSLEKVIKMAPGHPEAHFLLGLVAFRRLEGAAAETRLRNALSLDPRHAGAHALLGRVLLGKNDAVGAVRELESALAEDGSLWDNHLLLASVHLTAKRYEPALLHAGRALEMASAAAPRGLLLRALAQFGLGELSKAAQDLEMILGAHGSHEDAVQARALLARIRSQETLASASAPVVAPPPAAPLPEAPAATPKLPEKDWAPADVDAAKIVVAPDVSCSVSEVLKNTGRKVVQLAENLQGISARETVQFSELDREGVAKSPVSREFLYMVSIARIRAGTLSVEETRDGRHNFENFPTQIVTRGLAAMALIFHPDYAGDFEFRCEGLAQRNGKAMWQVHFRQRADRPSRVRAYHTRQGRFALALKGRAWIAASTFHIQRIETDLVAPVADALLDREHLAIEYRPVSFTARKLQLWLPQSAEMHAQWAGRRYRQQHAFSKFTYFTVDTRQKIQDPKSEQQ
jgi:Tfp pilus assembly protein PilF